MLSCSLIIATLGRKQELARLLDSLATQTRPPSQIILVDQNPQGYLEKTLEPYRAALPLVILTAEPKGVSLARNIGLEYADGDIIAFPDDDCWYLPDTLERVCQCFDAGPALDGLIVAWAEQPCARKPSGHLTTVDAVDAFRRAGTLVQFYRSHTLTDVRYDPLLGPGTGLPYGCGEDTDYLLQILKKGHGVKRSEEVLVGHPEPDTRAPGFVAKTRAYAQGRMYLLRKHGFPLWFKVANIVYPLVCLVREGPQAWQYRKEMFLGRLTAFFQS